MTDLPPQNSFAPKPGPDQENREIKAALVRIGTVQKALEEGFDRAVLQRDSLMAEQEQMQQVLMGVSQDNNRLRDALQCAGKDLEELRANAFSAEQSYSLGALAWRLFTDIEKYLSTHSITVDPTATEDWDKIHDLTVEIREQHIREQTRRDQTKRGSESASDTGIQVSDLGTEESEVVSAVDELPTNS